MSLELFQGQDFLLSRTSPLIISSNQASDFGSCDSFFSKLCPGGVFKQETQVISRLQSSTHYPVFFFGGIVRRPRAGV